jgi:hypothetical protein
VSGTAYGSGMGDTFQTTVDLDASPQDAARLAEPPGPNWPKAVADGRWTDSSLAFVHLGFQFWNWPQGLSRSTRQLPSGSATYRNRSCSRFSRPCQNSTDCGATRKPPQCGGTGTCSPSG